MNEQTLVERLRGLDKSPIAIPEILQAADRIEELETIVGGLPKTADGVPVVPSEDYVYSQWELEAGLHFLERREDGKFGTWFNGQWRFVEDCYSTRSAAEQAAQKKDAT